MPVDEVIKLFEQLGLTEDSWPKYLGPEEFSSSLIENIAIKKSESKATERP